MSVSCDSLSEEQIVENWAAYDKLCRSVSDGRSASLGEMLDKIGAELSVTPASSRRDFHNAFPGGLVEHSLRVLRNALKYSASHGIGVSRDSVVIAALFHDIGKMGDGQQPYYVVQSDSWRRDKLGEMYAHNPKLTHMSVGLRGLFLLHSHGVKLTQDEWLAIYFNDGWVLPENKQYCLKEPALVHVIQTADYLATLQEKRGDSLDLSE